MKKLLKIKVVGSKMRWTGLLKRMDNDRLKKRVWEADEEGRWRRGRPRLRWGDSLTRDLRSRGRNSHEWVLCAEERHGSLEGTDKNSRGGNMCQPPPRKGSRGTREHMVNCT